MHDEVFNFSKLYLNSKAVFFKFSVKLTTYIMNNWLIYII